MTIEFISPQETAPYLLGHILERWNSLRRLHNQHNAHSYLMDRLAVQHRKMTPDRNPPQNLKRLIGNLLDRWDCNGDISEKRDGDALLMRQLGDELAKLKEAAQ
ncbi:MAG: hypothetical protein JKY47_02315 [Thalassospira sp.]|jgi:hypothetical protein|nr:hypothetical protein [Thalassospira sp.]